MVVFYSDVGVQVKVESNQVYLTGMTPNVNGVTMSPGPVCRQDYGRGSSISCPVADLTR